MWFRSKPKETAEEKNTNIEKPKPDKKKKRRPRRIAVKIWVNVIMLAIIGLLCLNAYLMWTVYPKNVSAVQKQKEPVQNIQVLNTEGASKFAKDFAAEWVQGNLDKVNYYLAIGYQLPKDALDGTKRKVLWAQEANVTQISANRVNVVVKLGVEMPSANQKTPTFKVVYLSVPLIVEADGKYGVCDIPLISLIQEERLL